MPNRNFFKTSDTRGRQERRRRQAGYQPPKKVEEHWDLFNRNLYVEPARHNLPAWLLPLLALILIVALVFWAAPGLINRLKNLLSPDSGLNGDQVSYLYDDDTWAVNEPVADIFADDDIKAARVTQALYNEPVTILSRDCTYGFTKVRLADGSEGYMLLEDLVDNRASIEPDLFKFKLVIAETTKRIFSHASKGTLLVEVPMGTVLFADYRGNGISRVALPDGQFGWLSDSGVIILPPTGEIEPVTGGARYFSSTALAFNQVTVLPQGQSVYGISTAGIARLAGAINGVRLPRLLADLAECGSPAELTVDEGSGLWQPDSIKAGDLVFLRAPGGAAQGGAAPGGTDEAAADLAVCAADGQVLYAGRGDTSIRLVDLSQDEELLSRVIFVRRLYSTP